MPEWLSIVIVAVIAASGGWLTFLTTRQSSANQRQEAMYKQLMDQGRATEDRLAAALHRIDDLEVGRNAAIDYAVILRLHIEDRKGPPAPAWPVGIYKQGNQA